MRASRMSYAVLASAPILVALSASSPARATQYELDVRRAEISYTFVFAQSPRRGAFTRAIGALDFHETQPEKSKVSAEIATASLETGQMIVDSELKGGNFFNAGKFPAITFKSKTVRAKGELFEVAGDITVNGITRPVTLAVSINPHIDPALKIDTGSRLFFAKTQIKRSAFGMTGWSALVDDDVGIEIEAIARPKSRLAKASLTASK